MDEQGVGPKVCLVGTAPPRRCGIATFTDDLRMALSAVTPAAPAVQVALTDAGGSYDYGPDVVFEIHAPQLSDYRTAATFLDQSDVDVVCVQHEFGIFGGPVGRHVDELLEHVTAPVVTTLHTVVADPPADLRAATRRIAARSDAVVVLAERAVGLLADGYGIDGERVRVIPHGVPSAPEVDQDEAKASIGATGRTVLLTFGLLGPGKGIEDVLDALPAVVRRQPDALYVVLGATHPHVLRDHGDAYRASLVERVQALGLEQHVRFVDRYVALDELCRHLAASDIYLTPYHGTEQIVSGTLAYAVGMGCAVVSTPYPYARELLAEGRGELVPFRDPPALAGSLLGLLGDDERRRAMRRAARAHGSSMAWPQVAAQYVALFEEVVTTHEQPARRSVEVVTPRPCFGYLRALTDDTGVFQHAPHGVPARAHGYCTDDVGRALVAAVEGAARLGDDVADMLIPGYLSFLLDAQQPTGHFANLLGFDRQFVDGSASEDTLGQAMWGLGTTVSLGVDDGQRTLAGRCLEAALPAAAGLTATKAVAYAMCGLQGYLARFPGALAVQALHRLLAERQLQRFADHSRDGWRWFDDALTYGNASVAESLLRAGQVAEEERWTDVGLTSLDFLLQETFVDGHFDFPGNEGWHRRDRVRAVYGQQPIEAGLTARACVAAHEITGRDVYLDRAHAAVAWLLGRNRLGVALYDPATGRCVDGLDRHGASSNTGAESTICALLGLLALPVRTALPVPPPGLAATSSEG